MFEAYKIGIRLSLINHASIGLLTLSKDFMRTDEQAAKLQKRIDSIKNQALKGGLMLGASGAILGMLKGPYEEAKALEQQRQKFQTINLSAADNARAFAQATLLAHKNLGSTIKDNIALIQDLHTATGDLPHALAMSESFQKFSIAARVQNDGKPVEGLVYNAVKALEHRGDRVTQDPRGFEKELDSMSRVYFGSMGKVGPNDFFHASQTGKMAYTLLDPEYLYGQFAAYMQAKTGSTAGTSSMTAFSSLIGGHMDNKAKGFLASLGLLQIGVSKAQVELINKSIDGLQLPSSEKAKLRKAEMPLTGGLIDGAALVFAHRPDLFVSDILVPAIRRRYGMDMSNEQIALLVAKSFNRSTSDNLGELIVNGIKFQKDANIFRGAKDFGGAYDQYLKSPKGAEVAAEAAWTNFLAVFGSIYLPRITNGLLKLAGGLNSLGRLVEEYPGPFKVLAYSLGLVGVGLGLRGGGLLLSAAIQGFALALGTSGKAGLLGAVTGLANPIGIAVLALGTLAAAIYAFRPISQQEVDAYKDQGGAKLSAGARARVDSGELDPSAKSRFMADSRAQVLELHSHTSIDGQKIASTVTRYQARNIGQRLGSGLFDIGVGIPSVGMK